MNAWPTAFTFWLQMLVGESFAMKTASYRILQAALTDMNAAGEDEFKTKVYALNPKSITMQQLYGADDPGKYFPFVLCPELQPSAQSEFTCCPQAVHPSCLNSAWARNISDGCSVKGMDGWPAGSAVQKRLP